MSPALAYSQTNAENGAVMLCPPPPPAHPETVPGAVTSPAEAHPKDHSDGQRRQAMWSAS